MTRRHVSNAGRSRRKGRGSILAIVAVSLMVAGLASRSDAAPPTSALAGDSHREAVRRDAEGMTTIQSERRRSPSGLRYPYPPARDGDALETVDLALEFGWLVSRGEEDEARHREYLDPRDGLWIRRLRMDVQVPDGQGRIALRGTNVGRADASYGLELEHPGWFRLRTDYSALDHTYASDARVLFSGVGGERLSLPAGLTPGNNTQAAVDDALASVGRTRLSQSRADGSVELYGRLLPTLTLRGRYRLERRDGERPWGGTLGLPFGTTGTGSVVELVEPIHSRTHDWSMGLEWVGERAQLNVAYDGSLFDNRREALIWENPFAATDLGTIVIAGQPLGRMALAPDNQRHRVAVDTAISTPRRGRVTASASWTRMTQDETLMPASINAGISDFLTLSRRRADARVDLLDAKVAWRASPVRRLRLAISARFSQRDSDTRYVGLDRTSGRYGYVVEDLAATDRVGATPYSHRRISARARAEWSVWRHSKLGVEYEHLRMHRSGRARRETTDDRARLHWTARGPFQSNHRLAYEISHRGGGAYDPTRDNAFYASSPTSTEPRGPSRSLRSFRQLDLARHLSHSLTLRSIAPIADVADVTLVVRWFERDFGATHGVQDERRAEADLDVLRRLSAKTEMRLFASFEWRDRRLTSIDSQPGPAFSFVPGSPTFPLSNEWSWTSRSHTVVVGAAASTRPLRSLDLSLEYRFQTTNESTRAGFDRTGGALTSTVDPATATTSLPVVRLHDHVLEAEATWSVAERLETSLFYRLHVSEFDDAQQRGIAPRVNQILFLAHRDRDFVAHLIGVTATMRY